MIATAFLNIAYYILSVLVGNFPASTGFPSQVSTAFSWLGNYLSILSPIVPITTLGITVGIVVGLELLIFGFKTFKWVISHIPFVGGR